MNQTWNSKDLEQMLDANDWLRLQEQVRSRAAKLRPIPTELKSRLRLLDNIRAVLLDVYGTLLVSEAGEILTAKEEQRQERTSQSDQQALFSLPELLRASLPENFLPAQALQQAILAQHRKSPWLYPEVDIVSLWHQIFLQQLNEDMRSSLSPFILARFALEYELQHNRVQLMPGTLELLHWLAARNFRVGIISNAQFYTPLILAALLRLRRLEDLNIRLCVWSYRHACSKPQLELFQAACRALEKHYKIQPQQVLYLGNDLRNDVWGAAQVGFHTGLFAGDQRSLRLRHELPEVAATVPDVIITELGQVKSVL